RPDAARVPRAEPRGTPVAPATLTSRQPHACRVRPGHIAMQRFSALILIAACAYGTSAQAIIRCELNGQAINVSNGADLAGKSGLVRCRDDNTGQIQREK